LLTIQPSRPPIFRTCCPLNDLYPVTGIERQVTIRLKQALNEKYQGCHTHPFSVSIIYARNLLTHLRSKIIQSNYILYLRGQFRLRLQWGWWRWCSFHCRRCGSGECSTTPTRSWSIRWRWSKRGSTRRWRWCFFESSGGGGRWGSYTCSS
jgi:hypothetical protein